MIILMEWDPVDWLSLCHFQGCKKQFAWVSKVAVPVHIPIIFFRSHVTVNYCYEFEINSSYSTQPTSVKLPKEFRQSLHPEVLN